MEQESPSRHPPRLGPRPLALHLTIATSFYMTSIGACAAWKNASPSWNGPPNPNGASPKPPLKPPIDPAALLAAVDREGRRQLAAYLDGVERYRAHPYTRAAAARPCAWREGTTRLIDYGGPADGPAVLAVPSLINRAHILDLEPDRGLMAYLAERGSRCFLLDWDAPGPAERDFDLNAYLARLARALTAACAASGSERVSVLGYCMGGTLAAALAARWPDLIERLALMAAPWDFHAENPEQARALGALADLAEPAWRALGAVPLDAVQSLFVAVDPMLGFRKFRDFAALAPGSEAERRFVALEDWLNDGVPLALEAGLDCLRGWYGANGPARGTWHVHGAAVQPADIAAPTLALIPSADRIVPPASALALARALPDCRVARPRAGHIGMVASRRARAEVWSPLAAFLMGRP